MLVPNEVCINTCDENFFVIKDGQCGLCSHFYPNDKKYKLFGGNKCLGQNEITDKMTDYNNKLNLLKCIDGYKMVNDECVEDITCPLNCEKCQNTELCQKCNSGYLLENGICREQCSNGFEKFSSGEECLNCNNNLCINFEINSCNCINCKENYFLKEDKTCQECD